MEWNLEMLLPLALGAAVIVVVIMIIYILMYATAAADSNKRPPSQSTDDDRHEASESRCESEGQMYTYQSLPPVPYELNMFLKVIIPKLHRQSKTATGQFAVLFLGNKNSDAANYELKLGGNCTKFTDPSQVSYPDDKNLGNYIVARHDAKDEHAEKFLLNRFEALQDTYVGDNNNCLPSFILIYSWCMPCRTCTKDIVKLKKEMTKEVEVTVVYRMKYNNKDPKNQEMLKFEGINVHQDKNYLKRS